MSSVSCANVRKSIIVDKWSCQPLVLTSEHFNISGPGHRNSPSTKILSLMGQQSKKERQRLAALPKGMDAAGCCEDVLNQGGFWRAARWLPARLKGKAGGG